MSSTATALRPGLGFAFPNKIDARLRQIANNRRLSR